MSGGERAEANEDDDWFGGGGGSGSDNCPEATCSPATPAGLHFYGEAISQHEWLDDIFTDGPAPTAAGGHQRVRISGLGGAQFAAVTDGTSGIEVESFDNNADTVTLVGTGNGSDYLRIVDPNGGGLYDRKKLEGSTVDSISIEPIEYEVGNGQPWVFKNVSNVAVALYGQATASDGSTYRARLVDSTMTMQLPTGVVRAAWDMLFMPTAAGTETIVVQAGSAAPATVDITTVDHIDSIEPYQIPTTLPVNGLEELCFHGISNGRPVAGLAWSFTLNGTPADGLIKNCVLVNVQTPGPLDIAAMAEGLRATVHVNVVSSAARQVSDTRQSDSIAGDRAAATR